MNLFGVIVKAGSQKSFPNKSFRLDLIRDELLPEGTEKNLDFPDLPVHLGIQFAISHAGQLRFQWRVDPTKIKNWRTLHVEAAVSSRKIAQIVGRIVWAHSIRLDPLCTIEQILNIAAKLGTSIGTNYALWDSPHCLDSSDLENLKLTWKETLCNNWCCDSRPKAKESMYLFTDASDAGWGYVLTDMLGNILEQQRYVWDATTIKWHIFIKEVAACVWTAKKLSKNGRMLHILVDNTAAEHAIRRGFSCNRIALGLIKAASLQKIRFSIGRIGTKQNPADEPSRGLICPSKKAWDAVKLLMGTVAFEPAGKTPSKGTNALRHCDAPDQEDTEDFLCRNLLKLQFDHATIPELQYRPVPM